MNAGPLVLVVDDDGDVRQIVRDVLEDAGYAVDEAGDGAEALRRLRAGPRPDLVLLDLMMPGVDGWGFREAQLADPALAAVPVVAFSGDGRVADKAASLQIDRHVRKPIRLEDLLRAVAEALGDGSP